MENPGRDIEYQKNVEIDGENYKVHHLMPSKGFKMGLKLTKYIGQPFAQMAAAASAQEDDQMIADVMGKAVGVLMEKLDEDELLNLAKDLVATCSYKNQPISFETHFQGRLGHLLKVVSKVIEVQFSDFFSAIVESVGVVMDRVKAA